MRLVENHKKGLQGDHGRPSNFLSQLSKLSHFNVLDLADLQCINTSDLQCINASDLQCITASDLQCINASDLQCINASDLQCITSFPFSLLMCQPWLCINTAAHLCLRLQYEHHTSFVINWWFRRIDHNGQTGPLFLIFLQLRIDLS